MSDESKDIAVAVGTAVATAMASQSKPEIPPPLKWAGAIVSALLVMAVAGTGAWLINTVNSMQQTLTRLDERSISDGELRQQINNDTTRRIEALEAAQRRNGQ